MPREYMKAERCKKGHLFAPKNVTTQQIKAPNGETYTLRRCRMCRSAYEKLRYRNSTRRQQNVKDAVNSRRGAALALPPVCEWVPSLQ